MESEQRISTPQVVGSSPTSALSILDFRFWILDFAQNIASIVKVVGENMRLIFLYGSPAVGKLTVANEIAKRTNFKVFHNHLSIDCIEPIFEFGSKSFQKLIEMIRVETVTEAARVGQNLIYTFCYAKDLDDAHVEKIASTVEENGGEIHFVLLRADRSELDKRVTEESRKKMGKAKTVEMMSFFHETYDLLSPVPARESLIIDNTNLSAEAAAQQIIEHFDLEQIKELS
jgi:broad-specificity NMP kinase